MIEKKTVEELVNALKAQMILGTSSLEYQKGHNNALNKAINLVQSKTKK
jgi:hypothetical protein